MKKINSITKSLLAAAVALLAFASVACKQNAEPQKDNADYLINKDIYVYDVLDAEKRDPYQDICYPALFAKDDTDPDGNTVSINWAYFGICDKITVEKTNADTLKLTATPHDIELKISTTTVTLNIKSFNGTYNLSTGALSFTCSYKNSTDSDYTDYAFSSKVESTLNLESLKNAPYLYGKTDFKITNAGELTFEDSEYTLTSPVLIGTNEWILSAKDETKTNKLRIKILPAYSSIKLLKHDVHTGYSPTEYKLVKFEDFTNTDLTVNSSKTMKFTPSTVKANQGLLTNSASTDKLIYKITSTPNLYTYKGTISTSSSSSGTLESGDPFTLVVVDSKTINLTITNTGTKPITTKLTK